jgi:hypothetical protein
MDVNDSALKESEYSKRKRISQKKLFSYNRKDIFIDSHSNIQDVSGNIYIG